MTQRKHRPSPSEPGRGGAGVRRSAVAGGALIALLTVIAFLPTLRGGFIWDDDAHVTANRTLRTLEGLRQIWFRLGATPQYYPLVHTTFWLEYHAWGLQPFGYHLVNVLLHATAAILLWRVLTRLALPGAWLAAAIFALHPVMVESVAWVTERKNVLSAVFYFGAALLYLRYWEHRDAGGASRRGTRSYVGALALYVAALLAKTVTCSLPAALLLVRWWKKGSLQRRDVLPLLPFFLVGAGLGLLTVWLEKHHVGAEGAEWSLSAAERCLLAGRAFWFYAGKLLWPAPLTFIYPRWDIDAGLWWQWLFPAAVIGLLAALWRARRRIGRGPLVAALFFAGTLAPALGFLDVYPMRYSFVADHFQYLACVGPLALCAAALSRLPRLPVAALAALPVLLGALTWQQARVYRSAESVWRDTLADNPQCWMAYGNLGAELQAQGRIDEAIDLYRRGIEIKPDYFLAHARWGDALASQGQVEAAIEHLDAAIRIEPGFANPYNLRGRLRFRQGHVAEAIDDYRRALAINPDYAEAQNNWGVALASGGKLDEAMEHYDAALRIDPEYAGAHFNRGSALAGQSRTHEAIDDYRKALELDPMMVRARDELARLLGPEH